jgi:hypothetical protein
MRSLSAGRALPMRPVADLRAHLADSPDTDFIESVTTADVAWTIGGLERERFTLSFPFAWKASAPFSTSGSGSSDVFGLRRGIPEGIEPHLGSQWWCLTRGTLERIFA